MVLIGTEVGLRDGTQITVTGMVDKLIQKALGVMLKQPSGGKIINIASIVSWFGGTTVPAYTASNGAVIPVDGAYLARALIINGVATNKTVLSYSVTSTE